MMTLIWKGSINRLIHIAEDWRHFFTGIVVGNFAFGFIWRGRKEGER